MWTSTNFKTKFLFHEEESRGQLYLDKSKTQDQQQNHLNSEAQCLTSGNYHITDPKIVYKCCFFFACEIILQSMLVPVQQEFSGSFLFTSPTMLISDLHSHSK